MAVSYNLAPIPKWYIADLTGKPLGAGSMYTYSSEDKTTFKFIYQDSAGINAWPDPVLFDENGSQGPFYWAFDPADPDDVYYIEVYDANGVLQWTIDDFFPPQAGGGSIITTALNLDNLITNNVMWRNLGVSANPVGVTFLKLAPGAHAGLAQTSSNAGPDICFIKNNTAATDQLQFVKFTLGSTPLIGDVTPVDYLKYACTNTPAGETKKLVQYPITRSVQNLVNQSVIVTIWARCNSGNTALTLQWLQFFGDGTGATASQITSIQTLNLTNTWAKYNISTSIPALPSPVTLGGCGNDGLFLQVQYPLGVATNIDFTKASVYLGNIAPANDYVTYDMIDGVINAPRTSYVFASYDLVAPFGYVIMNDGTIGSASSGATTRANVDTFPLYNWLWTNVSNPSANMWCPVTGGLGADPIADFTANKPLQLQKIIGRAIASAGAASAGITARTLGEFLGEESHTLSISEMPSHDHPGSTVTPPSGRNGASSGGGVSTVSDAAGPTGVTVAAQGGGAAHNIMQPTSFLNFFIKL